MGFSIEGISAMDLEKTAEIVSRSQLRHFAWCISLVLALAAWGVNTSAESWLLKAAAGAVFALGTLWPAALTMPHRVLMAVTYPVRWAANWILLAVVYYGVLTPVAFCVRLWRPDGLQCRLDADAATHWQPRAKVVDRGRDYRQF
jgi:hypothetical protein